MELPQFTTLNADVVPTNELLDKLERHQPKISTDLIRKLMAEVGVHTQDERIYTLASVVLESQMLKIVSEMKAVPTDKQKSEQKGSAGDRQKSNLTFEDLQNAMSEFGVQMKRPPFLSEKQTTRKAPALKSSMRAANAPNEPQAPSGESAAK